MFSAGDEARRRIDEVRFRNLGGNMEAIPGFNFEYNDHEPPPPPSPPPRQAPELGGMARARRASDGAPLRVPYKVVLKPKNPGPVVRHRPLKPVF